MNPGPHYTFSESLNACKARHTPLKAIPPWASTSLATLVRSSTRCALNASSWHKKVCCPEQLQQLDEKAGPRAVDIALTQTH